MSTTPSPREFYDAFAGRLVRDYVSGNDRVARQLALLRDATPRGARAILVVGFGSGLVADFLARRVARRARIVGVDLSAENAAVARRLFPHRRIEYRAGDILSDAVEGPFDVVVLPDVYEHVPRGARATLHQRLAALLAPDGRVVLTAPSAGYQRFLRAGGGPVQPVDEVVEVEDLLRLARDLGGELTYLRLLSVWRPDDYVHAVVERACWEADRITPANALPIRLAAPPTLLRRALRHLLVYWGPPAAGRAWRRLRVWSRRPLGRTR